MLLAEGILTGHDGSVEGDVEANEAVVGDLKGRRRMVEEPLNPKRQQRLKRQGLAGEAEKGAPGARRTKMPPDFHPSRVERRGSVRLDCAQARNIRQFGRPVGYICTQYITVLMDDVLDVLFTAIHPWIYGYIYSVKTAFLYFYITT